MCYQLAGHMFSLRKILFPCSKVFKDFGGIFISRSYQMDLSEVVSKLESFAPVSLAEKWDNVGLLVEPSGCLDVNSILLTNDLTEKVLDEAIEKKVQMIFSYHPPIFVPLKRLTSGSFKERIIVKAIEERLAIYSPHTAFDAVYGGVNDWLASGLGEGQVVPLSYSMEDSVKGCSNKLIATAKTRLDPETAHKIEQELHSTSEVNNLRIENIQSFDGSSFSSISLCCSDVDIAQFIKVIKEGLSSALSNLTVQPLAKVPIANTGTGRLCTLSHPVSLEQIISRVKKHLQLKHVRLAFSQKNSCSSSSTVSRIAVCAGSGGHVLKGIKADVLLTGEMSHHEVLEAMSNGCHVILCEHSNTERGFLKLFQGRLSELLGGQVKVLVSSLDADPLQIV